MRWLCVGVLLFLFFFSGCTSSRPGLPPPDPCEQDDPHTKDKYALSGFHWAPDGHCYADTSYYINTPMGNLSTSCPIGQHPNWYYRPQPPKGMMLGTYMGTDRFVDGSLRSEVDNLPISECVPGVSYVDRLTRDAWSGKHYWKDAQGHPHVGR